MPEIILRFEKVTKKGADFDAPVPFTVKFEGRDTEQFEFTNPLTDKDLAEIRWYLERYWEWPSEIDRDRARAVEGSLPQWGKALFDAVFAKTSDAMRLFEAFDGADGERVLTIDTNEPRILRLPWELLRDEGGYLFSKRPPVSIRRHMHKTAGKPIQPFELPVRILMVTSRPEGAGFIDPRSIAAPLLSALDGIPEQVEVEFLRPPTLKSLDDRLRDGTRPRVHIVHFDGHGEYKKDIGLGFLLFEDDKHKKHQVDAEQLGTLLNESGIPLVVLNACQSAQPDDRNPFASVASRLIESGVGGVVAMNYSVLVETAKRFTSEFYGALARGLSAGAAMDSARRGLFADTKRLAFLRPGREEAEAVHLQDWFLPALYQQAEELTPFAAQKTPTTETTAPKGGDKSTEKKEKGKENLRALREASRRDSVLRGKFPPSPLHGFHGRARELLDLERAFATRSILVLHGFGGQGKTSLAAQAAEWFTRTRLFERAAFISFENGASFEFVLNELGNALVEENFQIHAGDKVEAIARSLQEKPALVVFDNFESVLPNGNAPMQELQLLLDAAAKWFPHVKRGTWNSALLITTRNPNLPHPAFTPGTNCIRKELTGLADPDALELAAVILEAYSLPRPPRLPLEKLLHFLKGHPLSLQLALPQLRDHSAEQLVAEYQTILPQMKRSEKQERNESLEVSLRFSLDRLGEEAKSLLTRLWVFEGGAFELALLAITEIPEDKWNALKPQLTSTALIRVEELEGVNVPFIHFHPTLAPFLRANLPSPDFGRGAGGEGEIENRKSAIVNRYWQVYYEFANYLYQADTQNPLQARSIVLRELPNLKRALHLALAAGALDEAVTFAECINWFLNYFGRWRERDEIAKEVDQVIREKGSGRTDGKITKREYLLESGRGERLWQQGRAAEAEKVFRALLSRLEIGTAYDKQESLFDQTTTLTRIGRCLRAQGRPSQAADFYRRALALAEMLEQGKKIRSQIGFYHADLADVLADLGQYAEARTNYEKSLAIAQQNENDRSAGVALGQLGTLAMRQGDLNEARKRYLEALEIDRRNGEQQGEAIWLHQLGMVAQEARDWDEAERCYKESVNIKEHLGDLAGVARTSNQLALVAQNAGRPAEAERWVLRAIELNEKRGDKQLLAGNYNNLASLYLSQNRLDEAETYARRALAIKETLDLSSETWTTYSLLAQLAEKRGRMEEAREWRRKEQESFAAFAGSDTQIKKFEPLIATIVAACQGNEEALKQVEPVLRSMENGDGINRAFALSARKLFAGERDKNVLLDGLSVEPLLVMQRVLQALGGEMPSPPGPLREAPPRGSQRAGEGEQAQGEQGITIYQLLEMVERAAGGDKELGGQLFGAFQQMARASDPTMRALGNALLRVLVGDRNPDLSQLPDELASAVRGLLGRLKKR